nr:retrovirus-related Pol polyprotein from transposon TNT 1-94 [Tanacetum cinerariifolium]
MVAAAKLSMLNPNEFELWKLRIEQYFLMTDYALWEEKLARKNKLKARGTLLMALPNEHQLKFNYYKSAKSLMEAIEKRLQKLISQLEIHGETISQKDINPKLLTSLPSNWKTHTLIWRNKPDLETLSMDELHNNLNIYEAEVMRSSSTTQNTQNIAFVFSNNTDITNKVVNTAHGVSAASSKTNASNLPNVDSLSDAVIYSFFASQSNSSQLDYENLKQIDPDDLEEIDLKWQMEILTMRARRFLQKIGRNLGVNGTDTIGFEKNQVECYNCHRKGYFTREYRAFKHQDNRNMEITTRTLPVHETTPNALVSQCDALGYDWSDQAEDGPTNFVLMAYISLSSSSSDSEVNDKYNTCELHTPKPDLVFADEHVVSESVTSLPDTETKHIKPSFAKVKFVKPTEHVKSPKKSVKQEESTRKTKYPRKNSHSPRATKNEISGILKAFITGIENLIDHKVKIIRCDNRTKFKNKEMNQFSEIKGIKREFSVARTPQQNGVTKRKNKTLIEVARTMLADSKLPTTFWAEAVNTVCYVQNRILVIKPHNKTPYEIFLCRKPALSFMRPFGCLVTILITLNHRGTKANIDAGQAEKKTVFGLHYVLLLLLYSDSQGLKNSEDEVADDTGKKRETANTNSTNTLNIVSSPVNVISSSFTSVDPRRERTYRNEFENLSINPLMPDLEDIADTGIFNGAYDDEVKGKVADFNNLELTTVIKPKKVNQALTDLSWIEAMQDELIQFRLQKVWRLVDLPKGKHVIGTKWVYRNKKDKRGIVIRFKARLFAQGYTQEEGINYDEVFASIIRIEAIRSLKSYQMDIKSAFLYGTIKEEVYVCQPPCFEDPHFPNKVYKVEKALYGLHQAPKAWYETLSIYLLENGFRRGIIDKTLFIKKDKCDILLVQVYIDDIIFGSTKKSLCIEFEGLIHKKFQMSSMRELTFFLGLQVMQKDDGIFISQDKYVADILKKFDFSLVKIKSTPIETNKALLKDEEAVDRIFRYLKGQPKLGLWYPRDSPFELEAFLDSDYAGASQEIHNMRLSISW